jgi:hypothetical protein
MSGRPIVALTVATVALLATGIASVTVAQEPAATVDWTSTPPLSGEVVGGNAHVTADAAGGAFPLARIDAPELGTVGYVVRGQVRYSDVAGQGYLEMWSVFADGSRYFSRTLATEGPMAALTGSADWRPFELPFSLQGAAGPERLEVNVVLPGAGTVEVSPLELVRLDGAATGAGAWLSDRSIGVAGALIGVAVGVFSAAIAWLVGQRRGRRFVLPAMTAAMAAGIGLVVISVVGWVSGQPPNVVLLVLVPGLILATVFGVAIPRTRRIYADSELRKMRAMDEA